jgi:hypothetical protein
MSLLTKQGTSLVGAFACCLVLFAACQTAAPQKPATVAALVSAPAKPSMAKLCGNCHTPQPGSIRGNFDSVAYKTRSLQIKLDGSAEILRFDPASLQVVNVKGEHPGEPLRDISKGKEVRVEFVEKDGKKFAVRVISKPPIKVPDEKLMKTEDVEKLVAMGPEKGKYTLIDARPPVKFIEGSIPTAINIPFVAFDKMVGKLPKEKDALIVYFCQGCT